MSAFYVFAVFVEGDDTILVANVNVNLGVLYRGKFRVYSAEKGFGVGVPDEFLGQSCDRPLRILEVDVLGSLTPVGFEDDPTCWTTNTLLILGWANAQFCADLQYVDGKIFGKTHARHGPSLKTTRLRFWRGKLHSLCDEAAVETSDCAKWFYYSRLHRDGDAPAVVYYFSNRREWWRNGKRHRDGGAPAVTNTDDGTLQWWFQGWKEWEVCADGTRRWFRHDRLHRDGNLPAVIHPSGVKEFWYRGTHLVTQDKNAKAIG
jgi:hypothetical protein